MYNVNPYVEKYENLYELTKNETLSEYYLYFVCNINLNKNRYNSPSTAKCAALIVSRNSNIPTTFDLCVYPKCLPDGVDSRLYSNKLSFHVKPIIFPTYRPTGKFNSFYFVVD